MSQSAENGLPAFGQPVEFTWHLTRQVENRPVEGDRYRRTERWKVWKPLAYPGQPAPEPRKGVLIGVRTLANGQAEYDYEIGVQFHVGTAERFTAYLIAYDLRRKPVLVLPEHTRVIAPGERNPE